MKKFVILLLSLVLLSTTVCIAKERKNNKVESNNINKSPNINKNIVSDNFLQQDFEKKFIEQFKEKVSIIFLLDGNYLFTDDYNGYLNGGNSLYGDIINKISKLNNSNLPNKAVNLQYLKLVKNNIENTAKNQTSIETIVIPDNDFKLLDEDTKFYTNFNNVYAQNDKTIYLNVVTQGFNAQIDKWQEVFNKNKNNPKALKNLYDEVEHEEEYIKQYLNAGHAAQPEIENKLKEYKDVLNSTSYIIYKQGESYEKQKFYSWAKKNNKKLVAGRLSNYVYNAYAPAPKLGYLYEHIPAGDFYLKVLQSMPGGVILTGEYMGPYGPVGHGSIFLQTSKQFADGKYILEPIIAEYKGYYDYYTVLGVKKRIYKFYRLGESEIKKNFEIPGQPFYFYTPY